MERFMSENNSGANIQQSETRGNDQGKEKRQKFDPAKQEREEIITVIITAEGEITDPDRADSTRPRVRRAIMPKQPRRIRTADPDRDVIRVISSSATASRTRTRIRAVRRRASSLTASVSPSRSVRERSTLK